MKTAVRYYSRSGNTRLMAEAIAKASGAEAISADAENAALSEPVDILFIGGALYAYGIDEHLSEYIQTLHADDVKKAVVFSTTWISKHSIVLIKEALQKQGISCADEFLYFRGKPNEKQLKEAEAFAKKFL
ncbi:MAG: flavodoxin family protein [Eubacterium sp.]